MEDDPYYRAALEAAFAIARIFGQTDPVVLARIAFPILELIKQPEIASNLTSGGIPQWRSKP